MACYSFISTEKIKDAGTFTRKMEHNFRLFGHIPNADPNRTYLNEELISLPNGSTYIDEYNKKILNSKYYQNHAVRKDAVRGIEIMMTYSGKEIPEDFDRSKWQEENIKWLKDYFGDENVISAVLHLDETTPHIHAIVIPMVNERLNAKEFLGGRQKLRELISDYSKRMEPLGLTRGLKGSTAKHTDIRDFYTALNTEKIKTLPEPKQSESLDDYYQRAQKAFEISNYQHLNEIKEKEREIHENNSLSLNEKLEFYEEKTAFTQKIHDLERVFGTTPEDALKKINSMNNINQGLKDYPNREYADQVYSGIREILRYEKEKDKHSKGKQKKTAEQVFKDIKNMDKNI